MSMFKGFNSVQLKMPDKSTFDLSHKIRMSARMGVLYPLLIQECIPSDRFRGGSEILGRIAPLLAPIYDDISMWVHYFFVPNRLLWLEWETFITGGRLGVGVEPLVAPNRPQIHIGGLFGVGTLTAFDDSQLSAYLGVPNFLTLDGDPAAWNNKYIDAMPFAAYQLVFQEYYRDRNFVDDTQEKTYPLASGAVSNSQAQQLVSLQARNYMHDYFTSALPWTQRGAEVLMPVALSGNAPLYGNPVNPPTITGSVLLSLDSPGSLNGSFGINVTETTPPGVGPNAALWIRGQDLTGATTSINDFRAAYALQVWLERNAIGGSRYNESTQAHFGIKPEDARLQRPEYIGGGRINFQISEVVSTAYSQDETDTVPLANMAGHGISYGAQNRFNYFATEHGFILGMLSIMAKPSYQQGLPPMFKRKSFLDYPWPTFAKLGEQPIRNYELYANPAALTEDTSGEAPIFGYQSRYSDWKWKPSTNAGDFRNTLLFWSLTRVFTTQPVLGPSFIRFQDNTQDRLFAVAAEHNFWLYVHNSVTVQRALPYFGTPNTMGFN